MRINGSDKANFNPYQRQFQKQTEMKNETLKKDQLEISAEAKQMQKNEKVQKERAAYVEKLKQAVTSGDYQVNHKKTAEKMLDFWQKP
jgi:negative regulator of flagellin synthesis FlgM